VLIIFISLKECNNDDINHSYERRTAP
jgi:hypothetical protein